MAYLYCILTGGNCDEFPELDAEIVHRDIIAHISIFEGGGRMYRISEEEMAKLPKDGGGHYLGTDNSGYSIYPVVDIEHELLYFKGSAWQQVR